MEPGMQAASQGLVHNLGKYQELDNIWVAHILRGQAWSAVLPFVILVSHSVQLIPRKNMCTSVGGCSGYLPSLWRKAVGRSWNFQEVTNCLCEKMETSFRSCRFGRVPNSRLSDAATKRLCIVNSSKCMMQPSQEIVSLGSEAVWQMV